MFQRAQSSVHRDYFCLTAPAPAVIRAVAPPPLASAAGCLVLTLLPGADDAPEMLVDGQPAPVVPFGRSASALVALALDDAAYDGRSKLELLLPRAAFDRAADHCGAPRISTLSLAHGGARGDVVMAHLGACLTHILAGAAQDNLATVDQIALALNLHIAQRYGALQIPRAKHRGGLAPWQLRRSCDIVESNLEATISLQVLADECGLSVSHFSRAFTRSTGLAPHRWMMQRRVQVAKEMLLKDATPLADIALACGFADQSHFTRTFATATGLTPGRWRTEQACIARRERLGGRDSGDHRLVA
ncbi:AraC family transcriptional regulator [Phenylobacterium sp.]|uniref:helix-turn-helix transcriptional regulator n=1 Tax=Phenylobacterium sp. TaxID=1871053 RepID=UPI00121BAB45|nr:AraC family transcriptional regulator [Phenylobacterium sp.]THD60585.1 MAG: AraC family transcriptional regulator [Phenylobacterium sp.]